MSGIVTGLKQLENYIKNTNERGNGTKVKWLKIEPGQSVKVAFLQEIDDESPGFKSDSGLGVIAVEHSSPDNFMLKAVCTADDGRCYGCEQYAAATTKEDRKWKAKGRLYINVLVDDGKSEPYVAVMSQGTSAKSITETLLMWAIDNASITDSQFRVKRNGSGTSTEYIMTPMPKVPGVDSSEYELFDIEKSVLRHVPYAEQEAFYSRPAYGSEQEPSSSEDSVESPSMEW